MNAHIEPLFCAIVRKRSKRKTKANAVSICEKQAKYVLTKYVIVWLALNSEKYYIDHAATSIISHQFPLITAPFIYIFPGYY